MRSVRKQTASFVRGQPWSNNNAVKGTPLITPAMTKHPLRRPLLSNLRLGNTAPSYQHTRRARVEMLEPRRLMATDLTPISNVTLYAGTTLHIALDGHDSEGDHLTYSVSTSNSLLSATVLEGNRSLKMSVEGYGDMIFELFEDEAPEPTARIIELVNQGFYDGLTFHRIIEDFMIQGGDPNGNGTGGSGVKFDDEYNANLQFTSSGILAMAKSSDDTNDSQFFITSDAVRHLDFQHSIFGFLTEGDSVRKAIAAVAGGSNGSTPVNSVVIDSMSVFVDEQNGTLRLTAPQGTTGQTTVTVTATDANGSLVTRSFTVTILSDPTDNYPFLGEIAPIHVTAGSSVSFTIPATDVEGDAMVYWGDILNDNSNLSVNVNTETGVVTITAIGSPGVYGVELAVRAKSPADYYSGRDVWDYQAVPVYVSPAQPTVTLLSDTGASDGITRLDNSGGNELQFRVSGVTAGALVTLYADGQAIGQATATSSGSITIQTNGTHQLSEGNHAITVVQSIANVSATIGNDSITTDLISPTSSVLPLSIDTTDPQIISAAGLLALEGREYVYNVQSNEDSGGHLTYSLVQAPSGMTIANPQNGKITWPPTSGQGGTHRVVVRVTDGAGNYSEQSFDLVVLPAAEILPISNQSVEEGSLLTLTVATEAESDMYPLTFSLSNAPAGATIDATTGVFRWTPSEAQGPGEYAITVQVTTAAGALSTVTFQVSVSEVNQPPVLDEIVNWTIDEDQLLEFTAAGRDLDLPSQKLLFTLIGAPQGATIDANTGRFRWQPNESQGGQDFTMTVRVTDSVGAFAERTFQVLVNEVDDVPQFEPIEVGVAIPGETLDFTVHAWDPDLPAREIRYSLEPGSPEGVRIDSVTGRVTWNVPSNLVSQSVAIVVRATEIDSEGREGLSVIQPIQIPVQDYRLALLEAALNELSRSRNRDNSNRLQEPSQAPISQPSGRSAAHRVVSTATVPGAEFNQSSLFGNTLGPDTGSGGNTSTLPQEENKNETPNHDGNDTSPADPQNTNPPNEQAQPKVKHRPPTSQAAPEAHDLVVQALTEETETLLSSQSEQPAETEVDAPAAPVAPAESTPAETNDETGKIAAR